MPGRIFREVNMKKIALLLLLAAVMTPLSAARIDDFSRGIVYFLVGDMDLAGRHLDAFFLANPKSSVKKGFALLLKNQNWEATKTFSYYLESDHRSLEALIGVSLSLADMKNTLAIENLLKITRINSSFGPAYLCLGSEFLKRRNFPAAEDHFKKGLQFSRIPEAKLLLSELYLQQNQPQPAVDLLQDESDNAPANYYYALYAARAFYQLGRWGEMAQYVDRALKVKPASMEGQLLLAQHALKTNDLRKAKKILEKLKFSNYNLEYGLTFAEVLVRLRDSNAEKYLYEVFSQNQWEPRINQMLGLYHAKKNNASVPNWIRRAILSGKGAEELRSVFPDAPAIPDVPYLEFFNARKIQWLGNSRLLVAGVMSSGEKEKLLVIDAGTLKTIKSFEYEGSIQDIFAAPRYDKVVFSTVAVDNEKVYIYTLMEGGKDFILKPVIGYALRMPSIIAAFNEQASEVYVTDGSLAEQAFVSPFTTLNAYGRKTPVYPNYPYPVYRYAYANDNWSEIKKRDVLRRVPIQKVQQYLAVADAMQGNPEVAKLVAKGRDIDITASEEVKIHFAADSGHFVIWFSDLKNAFQALAYDPLQNSVQRFDETMFLGENYYSELDVISFNPDKKEILFLTRDKEKNLYLFNYRSLLYKKLGNGILAVSVNPEMNTVYFLSERTKFMYYSESNLEIVRLEPYGREKVTSRRDVSAIVDCRDEAEQYVATFNGELLRLDEERRFHPVQVSLAGTIHQPSPDLGRAAAFINGRIYVLPWQK
jgi:tetratricopeptide (TPR) repeat protein